MLDATFEKVRENGPVISMAVLLLVQDEAARAHL